MGKTIQPMYDIDKELVEKLKLHSKGEYNRFSQGDVEYLILTILKCNQLEQESKDIN